MTKGLLKSLRRGPQSQQLILKHRVNFKGFNITVNGATGIGFGSSLISRFPEGEVFYEGGIAFLSLTTTASGIVTNYTPTISIGSTPTSDAVLSGADVDIMPATSLGLATAGTTTSVRIPQTTATILNNTSKQVGIYLNCTIPDADISANNVLLRANGELVMLYTILTDR